MKNDSRLERVNHTRYARIQRRKKQRQRRRIACACMVCSLLISIILFSVLAMNASAETIDTGAPMYKYYASVQIMNGDSLWSIAAEYTDGSVSDILSCIDEIRSINHLSRFEKIKAGEFLIVPYYSAEIL